MSAKRLFVLAGGFGTRLRSAVSDVPKPLAPVFGKPYLNYMIESWVQAGVTQFAFLLHHEADKIKNFLGEHQKNGYLNGCDVSVVTEPSPLGTGGSLAYAVQELGLDGSFLVSNADTWLGSGIWQLSAAEAPAIAIVHVENSQRYGGVWTKNNKVVRFEEKQNAARAGWINAGLYHLHADLFKGWSGQPFSMERELLPRLVNAGQLNAVCVETDFVDIGIPDDYFRFCKWIESGKVGRL